MNSWFNNYCRSEQVLTLAPQVRALKYLTHSKTGVALTPFSGHGGQDPGSTSVHWKVHQARKAPPTTTQPPVTTTSEQQIYDQATTTSFDGFLSLNPELGGVFFATEYAVVTITGSSISPGAGTVSFFDPNGSFVCTGELPISQFDPLVSCGSSSGLASATPAPIRGVYSSTQSGYDDGSGTSYWDR